MKGRNLGVSTDEDRRSEPRYPTQVVATIEDAQYKSTTFTTNGFSRTGAFLQPSEAGTPLPPVGTVINLVLHWPIDTDMPPVRLEARVIHQTEHGVGVRFQLSERGESANNQEE